MLQDKAEACSSPLHCARMEQTSVPSGESFLEKIRDRIDVSVSARPSALGGGHVS